MVWVLAPAFAACFSDVAGNITSSPVAALRTTAPGRFRIPNLSSSSSRIITISGSRGRTRRDGRHSSSAREGAPSSSSNLGASSTVEARSMASYSTVSIPSGDAPPPTNDDVSSLATIIEPGHGEGIDALLYFLPGAFTAPSHYLPLLTEVQSRCSSFRLWVAILDPGNSLVRPAMVEASFDGVLERIKQMGFASEVAIFAGHSWGAWEARAVALKRAQAFIQLGSCFHTNPDNLVQYPKPVLTLSGALDGQLSLAAIAKHAGEVYAVKEELGDFYVQAIKPVIIVPGMNHAQFSHGSPNKERGDLDAEISAEQARDFCARILSSFITIHGCGPAKEASSQAIATLREGVTQTHELLKSFWEAIDEPGRDVKRMQLELAALPSLTESNIGVVQHDYKDNFIYSKPFIDGASGRIIVSTFLSPTGKFNLLSNIWVKFKSREAVATIFKSGEATMEPQSIGAHLNAKTFDQALSLVPEAARKKYEERGKKLRFLDDLVIKSSAQDWIDSDLVMKPADDGTYFVDVQSTAVITPVHGVAERFAGMHYLKLLTAARAFSWIFVDSFR